MNVCRVCLKAARAMTNIFDGKDGISVADMISECTGFKVYRGDSLPEAMCSPCKEDAKNAFELKQLYVKSHWLYCKIKKDLQKEEDELEEESCETSDYEETNKEFEEDSDEINEFYLQVKNEAIEDDIIVENHTQNAVKDIDYFDFEVKTEEIEDNNNKTHTGEKPHKCPYCPKSFRLKHHLSSHILSHTGERPFKCHQCLKSFPRKQGFQRHIATHSMERPYQCQQCQKSFTENGNLKRHIRIHTGEKPYKCLRCQKYFSQKGNLQRHIRTHTGERSKHKEEVLK